MKLGHSLKAVGITLLAVIIAVACADNPRQVKKKPGYRGWTKMTESRYGPTVRDDGTTNIQTRAWNSRRPMGKRIVPQLDSFAKREVWGPRPGGIIGTGKRDWDFVLSPEEINNAFGDDQLVDNTPVEAIGVESNDVLRELMDYVKREGLQK